MGQSSEALTAHDHNLAFYVRVPDGLRERMTAAGSPSASRGWMRRRRAFCERYSERFSRKRSSARNLVASMQRPSRLVG